MNLLYAIKNLSESIAIANETLQACVRELQAREQREMELARNREEMSQVNRVPEFLKKDTLQWVKFEDETPTEKGGYLLGNPASDEICLKIFCLQEALPVAHRYTAWLKIPEFKDNK